MDYKSSTIPQYFCTQGPASNLPKAQTQIPKQITKIPSMQGVKYLDISDDFL